jgi:ABC-type polar amino acid transport system ATPase subunit
MITHITLDTVSKNINGKQILSNINLEAYNGDIIVLLGASGGGKTTLLRIISGLDKQYNGKIIINGKLQSNNRSNPEVGLVFQDFHLWSHFTVLENITAPLEIVYHVPHKNALEQGIALLQEYGLIEHQDKKISELSGGQKQRLAIARAVATKPAIICFDEPFSALDPYLTKYVIKKIKELQAQGYIVILTTHNVHILPELGGTIYFLNKGIIEQKGSIEALDITTDTPLHHFIHGNE